MEMGFWKNLKRPVLAMAPMANVTDAAFRHLFTERGSPDVFWTEFVSVEGLLSKGKEKLLTDLWFSEEEHPIVAQVFGSKPEQFEEVAGMLVELGFDGIDINMGCPDAGIEKSGAGAALMKKPALAKEIIRATKRGAGSLPVSVKTRIGYSKNEIETWIPALLEEEPAALIVHLRTRNEMSDVPAHWELAAGIRELRNSISPETLILGNGDVETLEIANARIKESGIDGAMVGRGMFGNPFFFSGKTPGLREKLVCMVLHAELFEKLYKSNRSKKDGKLKNFDIMKKHFKAYCAGFDGAKELRMKLMETESAAEARKLTEEFLDILK
jgi:nifR3 family TIM-barrel protein